MKRWVFGGNTRMTGLMAPLALTLLAGCDGNLKKNKAEEQNQARAVVDAHFYLPESRDLASAQGASGDGVARTNAYQVSYKTVGRCEKVQDTTVVGSYEQGKRISLNFIPTCNYNFKVALGWSDQLAAAGQANSASSGNRIKPIETAGLALSSDRPTYETEIKDVIARNCFGCHNSGNALGGIDIGDFAKAKARAQGSLGAIQRGTMPKGNPGSMSAEDKRLFTLWVEQGTAENEPADNDNSNDDNSNDDSNDNSNNDNSNNDNNNNDNNQNDTPQRPGNSNNASGGGNILPTIFLESSLLEIRAEQLEGRDEVEITDIRMKPTADGEQAGFTSAVSTLAP